MPRLFALHSAIALSLGLHLAAAALWLEPADKGAQAAGAGGLIVSLGPAGRSAGGPQSESSEVEELVEQEVKEPVVEEILPVETPHVEQQVMEPIPETEPLREPTEIAAAVPEAEAEPVEPEIVREPEPQPLVEIAEPLPVVVQALAERPLEPIVTARPKPRPDPPVVRETSPPPAAPAQMASLAGEAGHSGTDGENLTGSGDDTPGGGAPGMAADYYTLLQAWLEKRKRYPRRAKLRREEGVVLLRFTVTRAGDVTEFGVEKSSGHKLLDEEARALLRRAQPLPEMPPEMDVGQLELRVPIAFFLR